MAQEIETYIKKRLAQGASEQEIQEALQEAGHEETTIQQELNNQKKRRKTLHRATAIAGILIALLAVLGVYTAQLYTTPQSTQLDTPTLTPLEQLDRALATGNPQLCEELDEPLRSECLSEYPETNQTTNNQALEQLDQALATGDPEACEELDEPLRSECLSEYP